MTLASSRLLRHEICMEQLKKTGAEIIDFEGVMFFVKYKVGKIGIVYLYHRGTDNTYLLERVKPYSMLINQYRKEEEVVTAITNDIDQFRNAANSKNFPDFLSVDQDFTKIVRYFEDLYLYYNIDKEDLTLMKDEIKKVVDLILDIKNRSKRVYYKTEPKSFK
ncbi:MAG: hypothetical protein N4A57_07425 [Anaeromicrobium sp.]|uniref:hypothetical protein n=1 Tax=Anaeromicrobium sp. TaxID=1929132 RepID=UPI0025D62294|nr:hypothetical protein [Anaeromicrobium sp.]MCT4594080.1 hypothetical protein [Anaeromicrobium sp.]